MKILHVCLAQIYSDDYSYQENLLTDYHKKQGNEVYIIASLLSFNSVGQLSLLNESTYKTKDDIKVYRIDYKGPMKGSSRFFRRYNHIERILDVIKPEIIFIHGCQFVDIFKFIKYKKENRNTRLYIDNHADYINSATNWLSMNILHKMIWRYCAKLSETYVEKFWGVTPLRCDFLQKVYKINPSKIGLLIMGVDDAKLDFKKRFEIREKIRDKLNISNDDFVIITGGKIDKKKNIHLLIKALTNIEDNHIKLVVFGNPVSDFASEFDELMTHENIIILGWINSEEVYNYFWASDLVVFPGSHSVLWEQAAGSGMPCIFKHWKGMEHVDIGGNCEFFEEDSVDEIERVLLSVISNPDVYTNMQKVALSAIEYFSYSNIAKKSIEICN